MSVFKRDRDPFRTAPGSPPKQAPSTVSSSSQTESLNQSTTPAPAGEPDTTQPERAQTQASGSAPSESAKLRANAAIIDRNSQLTGTLHSEGNVLIEGCFQGEIEAKETVMVEAHARTEAKLRANDVIIAGSFDGVISCQHRVQIKATATIKGEVQTPILVIEEGSTVDCCFKMTRTGG
jgi:cytoskeletal protein CcmA (bactofilin family)